MKRYARVRAVRVLCLWTLVSGVRVGLAMGQVVPEPLKPASTDLGALQDAFVALAQRVKPGVVTIASYDIDIRQPGSGRVEPFNHGSGFVLSSDGFLATSFHVIDEAVVVTATLADGSHHFADLVGTDYRSDLAVLRIDAAALPVVPMADMSQLKVGQWAFTVGNPYGVAAADGNTAFSMGVVSALGRSLTGRFGIENDDRYFGNLIETTLNFHPGNSGGPVLNILGEVIGIAAATLPDVGGDRLNSFAIPMSARTRRILETLQRGERIHYGALGADTRTVASDESDSLAMPVKSGAMITLVSGGGSRNPAARAGLRRQDIITSFDGQPVRDSDDLLLLAGATPVGQEVEVTYYRKGEKRQAVVLLTDLETLRDDRDRVGAPRVAIRMLTWRGAMLVEPTKAFLEQRQLPDDASGLYVRQVPRGTLLHARGVRADVFIVEYNGVPVRTIDEFIVADDAAGDDVTLTLSTGIEVTLSTSEKG